LIKENIYIDLKNGTEKLLEIARDLSYTLISDNCLYIISEIKDSDKRFHERDQLRKKENGLKVPKTLVNILLELNVLYPNFYDVNLYIYKAAKQMTIIEIQYYPRSSLDLEYQQFTQTKETMLHCKVSHPAYYSERNEKFDINWEFGPLNHIWKMFWWKRKLNKRAKHRGWKR